MKAMEAQSTGESQAVTSSSGGGRRRHESVTATLAGTSDLTSSGMRIATASALSGTGGGKDAMRHVASGARDVDWESGNSRAQLARPQ